MGSIVEVDPEVRILDLMIFFVLLVEIIMGTVREQDMKMGSVILGSVSP